MGNARDLLEESSLVIELSECKKHQERLKYAFCTLKRTKSCGGANPITSKGKSIQR